MSGPSYPEHFTLTLSPHGSITLTCEPCGHDITHVTRTKLDAVQAVADLHEHHAHRERAGE